MATMTSITVIIPTRERSDVLRHALKTVTSQSYDDLEIIVSDNFSQDDTKSVVLNSNDSRVKYINTGRRVGMSANWEFALSHVTGGWVTIMGDDDGLLPGALERVVGLVREHPGIEAIRSDVCQYQWPSAVGKSHGRVQIPLRTGCEIRNSRDHLRKAIHGEIEYQQLPMLYNGGFVKHEALKGISDDTGVIYKSCAPDVYAAVAVARTTEKYLYCFDPLAINGASQHSTGTSAFSLKSEKKKSVDKFYAEENIPFHEALPLLSDGRVVTSVAVLVYEAYLQSAFLGRNEGLITPEEFLQTVLRDPGRPDDIEGWARSYAGLHGLSLEDAQRQTALRRRFRPLEKAVRFTAKAGGAYAVGTPATPIPDVFAAAQEVARILERRPSLLVNGMRLAGSAMKKALGQG